MQRSSKFFVALTIITVLVLLFYMYSTWIKSGPQAHEGFIDLSSWDFAEDGVIKISGNWEWYEGQLLTPEDFRDNKGTKPKPTGYINITAANGSKNSGADLAPKGIRTFRLTVKTNKQTTSLGLKIGNVKMSSKLYINDKLMVSNGIPASKDSGYRPVNSPYRTFFYSEEEEIEIILQTANYDFPYKGLMYSILLGDQQDISFRDSMQTSFVITVVVACLLLGIYYLFLYISLEKTKDQFYSFIMFFSIALVLLTTNEKMLFRIIPGIPFELFMKIQAISFTVVALALIKFTNLASKEVLSNNILKLMTTGFFVYILLVIFTPYSIYVNFMVLRHIALIAAYLYILFNLIGMYKGIANHSIKDNLMLYGVCLSGLIISSINSCLYTINWLNNQIFVTIGLSYFIVFSQAFLALRFTENYYNMIKMDKLKDEFFTKTSYELKAPLSSIINISDDFLSERNVDDYDKKQFSAAVIKNIALRLMDVINSAMDATLLSNDQLSLNISGIDAKVCTELVVDSYNHYIHGRQISVDNQICDPLIVRADANKVRQIIWNLLLNAGNSMDRGKIKIWSERIENNILICVQDEGCGIPKEKREDIFKPYITLKSNGIGLGLYVSSLLAEKMRGRLWLESSEEDKGSLFILSLLADNQSIQKTNTVNATPKKRLMNISSMLNNEDMSYNNGTVLIVDNEIFNIQKAASILKSDEYRVLTAYSGEEALRLIEENNIDLVILDMLMFGNSGIKTCKEIRTKYTLFQMPILISTVGNVNFDLEMGIAAGANDFVTKPFEERELSARVKTLISLKMSMEDALKNELAFLHAQIKPHFIYNAINTIVSFCYTDGEKAADLLVNFSNYLKLTFNVDNNFMLVPLTQELQMIDAYVNIEKARFGEKIEVITDISPELLNMEIPPLCIQPLVENSIKHGILPKGGGCVYFSVKQEQEFIVLKVRDNGLGVPYKIIDSIKNNSYNKGVGLFNVIKRIKRLGNIKFDIKNLSGNGTEVTISVKAKEVNIRL